MGTKHALTRSDHIHPLHATVAGALIALVAADAVDKDRLRCVVVLPACMCHVSERACHKAAFAGILNP